MPLLTAFCQHSRNNWVRALTVAGRRALLLVLLSQGYNHLTLHVDNRVRRQAAESKRRSVRLDAAVLVSADDRTRLEHLARYLLRPPVVSERLSLDEHGRVQLQLRNAFRDGSPSKRPTGVVLLLCFGVLVKV